MTLIKSISGIRGTIGGKTSDNLTPLDIVKFTAAYCMRIKKNMPEKNLMVIVGRDARISGTMLNQLVCGTISGMGIDVIDIGLATTPTTEIAVKNKKADGGIILTASHNPKQWNALKLLDEKGEFLSAEAGKEILEIAEKEEFIFAEVDKIGKITREENYVDFHIQKILSLPLVDVEKIRKANFTVAIDAVNSVGGIAVPKLLSALGANKVISLYCNPNGHFPHNPEPLPENLTEISKKIVTEKADVGFVVDPDVDRLAVVCENGKPFGEEYTLVAVADYVLSHQKGNSVSNLSSTRALRDVTENHGGQYFASAVGEVNVVKKMKQVNAVIGGEGNGGVIYPKNHYGRDALVGIALFLTLLATKKIKCSELRKQYPDYVISKNKIQLLPHTNVDKILKSLEENYKNEKINTIDGIKIDFSDEWVHLRKSNTEPIIRIYAESKTQEKADILAQKMIKEINQFIRNKLTD